MHLFASFMLRAFFTLLKNSLFVKGIGLPSDFTIRDGEKYFNHESKVKYFLCYYYVLVNKMPSLMCIVMFATITERLRPALMSLV